MRTYVLWEGPNVNLLIDERKIEEKILLGDNTYELSWDGHNWRPIVFDSNYGMVEKIIKVADSYIDLDQFDGRNWSTGNPFEHVRIHKIIQMDNSTLEDHYIAICTSDYQGIHPWGIILESKQELRKYLEVNYRDQYYNELISL